MLSRTYPNRCYKAVRQQRRLFHFVLHIHPSKRPNICTCSTPLRNAVRGSLRANLIPGREDAKGVRRPRRVPISRNSAILFCRELDLGPIISFYQSDCFQRFHVVNQVKSTKCHGSGNVSQRRAVQKMKRTKMLNAANT
jgi:hypothetical protein